MCDGFCILLYLFYCSYFMIFLNFYGTFIDSCVKHFGLLQLCKCAIEINVTLTLKQCTKLI